MADTVTDEACIETKRFFFINYIFLQRSNILALIRNKNDEEVMKCFIIAYWRLLPKLESNFRVNKRNCTTSFILTILKIYFSVPKYQKSSIEYFSIDTLMKKFLLCQL